MKNWIAAGLTLFVMSNALAVDPCPELYAQPYQPYSLVTTSCRNSWGNNAGPGDIEIQVQYLQVLETRKLVKGQEEMIKAIAALAEATKKLAAASDGLLNTNTAWRQNVVDTTVAEINKIPVAMSQNVELVNALSAILTAKLAADPAFRDQVKASK
ncbi:hypothetical protein [Cupriavidus lacunae]|uniref:Uncharacterized protein n=1 Tax=Cupriavidus lacunae TaxID=2666307 RepID=A0A370NPU4_9BURK|nr:hypothetical protein [Cupriavidus lacunae]RDK07642.1 hypothetical protein DN412_24690 [Cupriavidus lacunae]